MSHPFQKQRWIPKLKIDQVTKTMSFLCSTSLGQYCHNPQSMPFCLLKIISWSQKREV